MFRLLKTRLWPIVATMASLMGSPRLGTAQAATANSRVRTAQQAFNTAQTKLNTARQTFDKAQQDIAKAQSACQAASNQVHQARQSAAQKHGTEIGMTAAIAERDAAAHKINTRRNTIDAELKTRADYQAAERDTDTARKRLSDLSEDKSLTDDQRQKLVSELSAKIRRPTEMRKAADAADPQMQQGIEQIQAAAKKIVALQPQVKKAIDSDPTVVRAIEQEKQAGTALEKARSLVTRAEQDFNTAQSNLNRQNDQLQAALSQSRRRR
jgi:chromosome segregation ATPase